MRPSDYHLDLCIATIDARAGLMPTRDQLAAIFAADHPDDLQERKQYLLETLTKLYRIPADYDAAVPVEDDPLDTAERELLLDVIAQSLANETWPSMTAPPEEGVGFLKALYDGAYKLGWNSVARRAAASVDRAPMPS